MCNANFNKIFNLTGNNVLLADDITAEYLTAKHLLQNICRGVVVHLASA
jgi:hypothetical protein